MSKVLDHDVVAVGWGLVITPLCAKKSLTLEKAARLFDNRNPTGISSQWTAITGLDDEQMAQWNNGLPDEVKGQYPVQCPDSEAHHHFLVNC